VPTPAKILIADDEKLVRSTLRSLLTEKPNWRVYEAADGQAAVDESKRLKPDLVILDIVMPVMSGIEAAYEMRRLLPDIKIILMSSHYTVEEAAVLARPLRRRQFHCKIGNGQGPRSGYRPPSAWGVANRLTRSASRGHKAKNLSSLQANLAASEAIFFGRGRSGIVVARVYSANRFPSLTRSSCGISPGRPG
jgi:CheY-like chemotaxis protein